MIGGSCQEYSSSEREVFTVWMKSLVISSNGCTVFNSKGDIVFRVDNYQTRRSTEILLMDYNGQVLFSIRRKVMQKQSQAGGVSLGDDVLSLMVEPQIDQSLIMALVIVYGMINHKL
ncbi:UNVERIFIED_CONTAM: protein LURP-one-related 2 [Sesamum radiatum]|uniref:Protein LURP-one-related 2 n=1 Tax=Sesamum radiatum TaxID=300843 RepID=A0AAW2TXB0_SESRA